jgi:hypothetical protein
MPADQVLPFPQQPRQPGLVRTVGNAEMMAAEARQTEEQRQMEMAASALQNQFVGLAGYIRTQWDMMVRHRNTTNGWSDRLLASLRAVQGQYDSQKLAEIRRFGGSEVYARLIAAKCRGATSLLRDVYLGADRAWGLQEPADPTIPQDALKNIEDLVTLEAQSAAMGSPPVPDPTGPPGSPPIHPGVPGKMPSPEEMHKRVFQLMTSAREAAKKHAHEQTLIAEDKLDEILTQGNFYTALSETLTDITSMPFCCLKGPTVRMVMDIQWENGQATPTKRAKLWWERVSPFDLWWTPGISNIEDAQIIHRLRITRTDLNDLIDLPGYNTDNIRKVLRDYGSAGLTENWDSTDATRAVMENRENPVMNLSQLLTTLEFHGNVQGRMLLEYGFTPDQITDPLRDYAIQAWLIGQYLIKVQLSPSPRRRTPFFMASFEQIPGSPIGNGIPDLISDLQEVCNATLRAAVNNMSIASGPQVIINDDRLAGQENGEELFPWKRWHTTNPQVAGSTEAAISFFQPQSNAQELMQVFNGFYGLADDVSAIPKYLSGNSPGGGAGRTASGLAMLMGNASKILQTVCANYDEGIMNPSLRMLLDIVLMTDTSGLLSGEEQVVPKGVAVAVQRETMRQRQLEFLQLTQNPIDMQIIGPKGRASVLRSVSTGIGLNGEEIVPSADQMEAQQAQAEQVAAVQGMPGASMTPPQAGKPGEGQRKAAGPPPQGPGNQAPGSSQASGPQTNLVGKRTAGP